MKTQHWDAHKPRHFSHTRHEQNTNLDSETKADLDLEHDLEHDLSHNAHPDGPGEHEKIKEVHLQLPDKKKNNRKLRGQHVTFSLSKALTLGPMHQMTYGLLKLAPINEFE